MIAATFRLDLRRSRSIALWAGLIGFLYASVLALVFPTLRENSALMQQYLALFPKEIMSALGVTGDLSDPGVFFNTDVGQFLWPVISALIGILVATRPVGADLERGFLELVVSSPLPRRAYLLVSIVGQLLVTTFVAVATVAGVIVLGVVVGAGFDAGQFLLAAVPMAAFAWAIAGFSTLLSVVTLSRGTAGGVTVGVLLAMYLAHLVSAIVADLHWLARLSIFDYFDTRVPISEGTLDAGNLAVLVGIAVVCWAAAVWLFGRRDLAA